MDGDGYSLRDIEVGEELTCDYRKIDAESSEDLGFVEE